MSGYALAWLVVAAAAALAAWLVFVLLRRFRRLRYLGAGLVLAWAVTPYSFDGEHTAPALAVALFRLLFETGAQWRVPLALAIASTLGVVAMHLLAVGILALTRAVRGRRMPNKAQTG